MGLSHQSRFFGAGLQAYNVLPDTSEWKRRERARTLAVAPIKKRFPVGSVVYVHDVIGECVVSGHIVALTEKPVSVTYTLTHAGKYLRNADNSIAAFQEDELMVESPQNAPERRIAVLRAIAVPTHVTWLQAYTCAVLRVALPVAKVAIEVVVEKDDVRITPIPVKTTIDKPQPVMPSGSLQAREDLPQTNVVQKLAQAVKAKVTKKPYAIGDRVHLQVRPNKFSSGSYQIHGIRDEWRRIDYGGHKALWRKVTDLKMEAA